MVRVARAILVISIGMLAPAAAAADGFSRASKKIEAEKFEQAARLLERCSDDGDPRCDYLLGRLSLVGEGVEPDAAVAAIRFRTAADAGIPAAQSNLGLLSATGHGVEQDAPQAAALYRQAASGGDPLGQAALGAACYLGEGVPQDKVEGYAWTSLAAAQGNEKARAFLVAMEEELTEEQLELARSQIDDLRPKIRKEVKRGVPRHALPRNSSQDTAREIQRRRQQR